MTREDAILHMTLRREELKHSVGDLDEDIKAFDMAIEALEQESCDKYIEEIDHLRKYIVKLETQIVEKEPCEDIEEIREVMSCDADAETKCKMISNILNAKPHYFKEKEPCDDAISRQAAIRIAEHGQVQGFEWQFKQLVKLPSVSTEKSLDKAKSEIRYGESKAYNADFTSGCEYAISVIERMFEEVTE